MGDIGFSFNISWEGKKFSDRSFSLSELKSSIPETEFLVEPNIGNSGAIISFVEGEDALSTLSICEDKRTPHILFCYSPVPKEDAELLKKISYAMSVPATVGSHYTLHLMRHVYPSISYTPKLITHIKSEKYYDFQPKPEPNNS